MFILHNSIYCVYHAHTTTVHVHNQPVLLHHQVMRRDELYWINLYWVFRRVIFSSIIVSEVLQSVIFCAALVTVYFSLPNVCFDVLILLYFYHSALLWRCDECIFIFFAFHYLSEHTLYFPRFWYLIDLLSVLKSCHLIFTNTVIIDWGNTFFNIFFFISIHHSAFPDFAGNEWFVFRYFLFQSFIFFYFHPDISWHYIWHLCTA